MNTFRDRRLYIVRLFALLLVFLGTHSASAKSTDPGGGIGGTGISGFGVVQKFGSIFVNGREYFLDNNTRITHDGVSGSEKLLHLGDVVSVEGRIDPTSGRSVALRVASELTLQGTIEKVDPASSTLTVLGQTVHLTSSTLGDGPENTPLLTQVHRDEHIAISGFVQSGGSWTATRVVRLATADSHFVLRGEVQDIDRERGRLRVSGQELNVRTLPAQLKVGDIVRVDGEYGKTGRQVESVTAARPMLGPTGRIVEISGYIQARPSTGQLVSNGILIRYSDASTVIGGTPSDLRTDVPVAVRGELQADGSVAVSTLLIDVEPMRVTLPLPELPTPGGSSDGNTSHSAVEKSDREETETDHTSAEQPENNQPDEPEIENPETEKSDIEKPEAEKSDIEKPQIDSPEIEKPEIEKPEIERPEIEPPIIDLPEFEKPVIE